MQTSIETTLCLPVAMPDGRICPELLTEEELIAFLRIPQVSSSKDYHNVIENLKRMHNLPRVHICGKPLYPVKAIQNWIAQNTISQK